MMYLNYSQESVTSMQSGLEYDTPCRKIHIMPTRSAINLKWKKLHTDNLYKLIADPHYFNITSMAQPLRSEWLKKKGAAAAGSKSGSPSGSKSGSPSGTNTGLFSFIKD